MKKLLLLALTCAATLAAAHAQTGRVSQGSHGSRRANGLADNFGIVPTATVAVRPLRVTRIVCQNDSMALLLGQQQALDKPGQPWQSYRQYRQYYYPRYQYQFSRADAVQKLHNEYPDAKLEGFDQPTPHKARGGAAAPRKPPRNSRYASLWAALAVGGVGWLLGRKRPV